ncbi:MAG: hypothetical protein QW727_02325 [Candidatus Pacearchaeota archaeon]
MSPKRGVKMNTINIPLLSNSILIEGELKIPQTINIPLLSHSILIERRLN